MNFDPAIIVVVTGIFGFLLGLWAVATHQRISASAFTFTSFSLAVMALTAVLRGMN